MNIVTPFVVLGPIKRVTELHATPPRVASVSSFAYAT